MLRGLSLFCPLATLIPPKIPRYTRTLETGCRRQSTPVLQNHPSPRSIRMDAFHPSVTAQCSIVGPDIRSRTVPIRRGPISLVRMTVPLVDAQQGRCLYCQRRVERGEIDHFVPWSRYPRDLAHNLVLAHKECNRHKINLLAAEVHLDRWLQRNKTHGPAISEAGLASNIIVDPAGSVNVAGWAYAHGANLHAAVWLRGEEVEPLSGRSQSLLVDYQSIWAYKTGCYVLSNMTTYKKESM